jgi:rhomboid protease GluP
MASRVCPNCGRLNGEKEERCYSCGRKLPGPLGKLLGSWSRQPLLFSRGVTLVCLLVFGLMVAADGRFPILPEFGFGDRFRTHTMLRFGALPNAVLEPWRLLSAIFVHYSLLHVGLNLWGLVGLGAPLENRLGSARTFLIFIVTGVGGFIVSSLWYGPYGVTAGASGGVFGLLGTYIGILITRKAPGWKDVLIQQLAYALVLGLLMRVNTAAHLGGFALGVGLGALFERERVRPMVTAVFSAMAVLAVLASVSSIVLSVSSPLWQMVRDEAPEE